MNKILFNTFICVAILGSSINFMIETQESMVSFIFLITGFVSFGLLVRPIFVRHEYVNDAKVSGEEEK